jgi:hypothetical protein
MQEKFSGFGIVLAKALMNNFDRFGKLRKREAKRDRQRERCMYVD